MRRLASTALAGAMTLCVALAGCGGSAPPAEQPSAKEEAPVEQIVGGWQAFDGTTPLYAEEEKAAFDKAVEGAGGTGYELVRTLGTQVVAGTNYAFLVRGTNEAAESAATWSVMVVYRDLEGNASMTSVQPIDLADPKVTDETSPAHVTGGWAVRDPDDSLLEPKEAADAFGVAAEAYDGPVLYPVVTLGTQVVAGTNYLVLCTGTPTTGDAAQQLYLATVYADLQGGAQITDVRGFDLLAYLS